MVLSRRRAIVAGDVLSFQHALPSTRAQVEYSAPPVTAAHLPALCPGSPLRVRV